MKLLLKVFTIVWTISVRSMLDFQNISDFSMRLKQKSNPLKKKQGNTNGLDRMQHSRRDPYVLQVLI